MYETPRLVKYGRFSDLTLQTQVWLKADAPPSKDEDAGQEIRRNGDNDHRPQAQS
jgi:hypothetical protein